MEVIDKNTTMTIENITSYITELGLWVLGGVMYGFSISPMVLNAVSPEKISSSVNGDIVSIIERLFNAILPFFIGYLGYRVRMARIKKKEYKNEGNDR